MEVLQKSLEEVISTLKGVKAKLDDVATEVKGNSEGVVRLTKQVDDFGVDLDVIRRQQLANDKAKRVEAVDMAPRPRGATSAGAQPHAVLTNNGGPLFPEPQHPREFGDNFHDGTVGGDGGGFHPKLPNHHYPKLDNDHAHERHDGYHIKPPKHPFPVFKGEFPLLWIDNCYTYFEMYNVLAHRWISTATLYFEDHAALWLQAYKLTHRQIIWDSFITAVVAEFGCDEYDGQMSALLQLRQTGTVAEYKRGF